MRHLSWMLCLTMMVFMASLLQYPITGLYGRLVFWPLLCVVLGFYILSQISSKVLEKMSDK